MGHRPRFFFSCFTCVRAGACCAFVYLCVGEEGMSCIQARANSLHQTSAHEYEREREGGRAREKERGRERAREIESARARGKEEINRYRR